MINKIILAVPCYNCEKQISRVLQSIKDFKHLDKINQILVVDNISQDNTFNVAKKFETSLPTLKVIQNESNVNLGGSHKIIFDFSLKNEFDFLVILHGDDQGNIDDICFFFENKKINEMNTIEWYRGSRFSRNSKLIGYSNIKKYGNIFFNIIFSLITLSRIEDIGSGLDIYKVQSLKKIPYKSFPNKLSFDYYLILYCSKVETKIKYFPLRWKEEDQVSNVRLVRQTLELFKIIVQYLFSNKFFNKTIN